MDNGACSYRRFLDGDEAAFDEIVEELFHPLVFFICRYVKDVHTAEDIAIDAFSDLVVNRGKFNFKVSLKTYLFMLGRSRALDHLRRSRRFVTEELSEAEMASDADTLEDMVLRDERARAVNSAVTHLPPAMRDAVHLVYFEEMSYEEAAKVMKKTKKQVDNLLYRAKGELRAVLGEDGVL